MTWDFQAFFQQLSTSINFWVVTGVLPFNQGDYCSGCVRGLDPGHLACLVLLEETQSWRSWPLGLEIGKQQTQQSINFR